MSKFWLLFKKEVKEIVTLKMMLPLIIMTVMFAFIGQLISGEQEKINQPSTVAFINEDRGEVFEEFLDEMEEQFMFEEYEGDLDMALKDAKEEGSVALIHVPDDFSANFADLSGAEVEIYTFLKDLSFISSIRGSRIEGLKVALNEYLSSKAISQRVPGVEPAALKSPSQLTDYVVLNENVAQISFGSVVGFVQSQTTFVPVILFLIIVIAAQMVATTIASEKENKSFEILLSSPLDRKTIVLAKILASGFMALVFAAFYMVGFGYYMSGITGGALGQVGGANEALQQLGVVLTPFGYLLIGVSLFLAILTALVIAIILGTMAEDVKGVQAVITPLMIFIMIPYFITIFLDLSSVSAALKYVVYAIPFSYPFMSIQKVITGDFAFILYGFIYQAAFFAVFVWVAAKIFTSDLVMTWKFSFAKKKKTEA